MIMKQFLLSVIAGSFVVLSVASMASASEQTTFQDSSADLNRDGTVTISEVYRHNRDYRGR